jgi:hypothetical protein
MLLLEERRLALEHLEVYVHGAMEAHPGAMEAHPGAMEAHSEATEVHLEAMEAHFGVFMTI